MEQRRGVDIMFLVLGATFVVLGATDFGGSFVNLWVGGEGVGIDLRMRVKEVGGFFTGVPVYRTDANAVYPPAGYAVIGALSGGADFGRARVLWTVQSAVLVVLSMVGVLFATRASSWLQRAVALLLVPGVAALAPGIGNGQVHIVTVVAGVAGVLLLARRDGTWGADLAGAVLMLICLAKPTNGSTFFILGCVLSGRLRPAALVLGIYAAVTIFTLSFVEEGWIVTLSRWVDRAVSGAEYGAYEGGSTNAHTFLVHLEGRRFSTIVTLGMLALFGEWAWRRKAADLWVLLGVGGIVARLCVYHRSYDDVLIVPALVALVCSPGRTGDPPGSATAPWGSPPSGGSRWGCPSATFPAMQPSRLCRPWDGS